jgi:hypothetical protein
MQCYGKTISVTSGTPTPQPAVVGEQIYLTTTPTDATLEELPIYLTLSPTPTWTVSGTNIGPPGWVSTTGSSGTLTPTALTDPTLTTYWIYPSPPGDPYQVTYESCVQGQTASPIYDQCTTATASFNVAGVTSPAINITNEVAATIDDLTGCDLDGGGPTLAYGNLKGPTPLCATKANPTTGTPGITFFPNGTPPGTGNFLFVQILPSGNTSVGTGFTGVTVTCTSIAGVDGQYPYQGQINPASTSDSPTSDLPPTYVTLTRNFNATMYLLWQSTAPGTTSIPVPLGYIPWTFIATATNIGTQQAPSWTASGAGAPVSNDDGVIRDAGTPNAGFVLATPTQENYGFPAWSGPSIINCVTGN